MLLALASALGCKAREREREPAGEAPVFHDQHLYTGMVQIEEPHGPPGALAVDVQRDTILLGDGNRHHSVPRGRRAGEHDNRQGGTIAMPNNDDVILWGSWDSSEQQIHAARPAIWSTRGRCSSMSATRRSASRRWSVSTSS
jgi:hypothetical protein